MTPGHYGCTRTWDTRHCSAIVRGKPSSVQNHHINRGDTLQKPGGTVLIYHASEVAAISVRKKVFLHVTIPAQGTATLHIKH